MTFSITSAFITKQWLMGKRKKFVVILIMLQVPLKTSQVESNKGLNFLSLTPVSPYTVKTTHARKYFFLIFFFFIKSPLIFFYRKIRKYSSESVVKESHLGVPIRGFKLRGFLQSLSWESFSVIQYTKRKKMSQNYLLLSTRPFCFLLHTF